MTMEAKADFNQQDLNTLVEGCATVTAYTTYSTSVRELLRTMVNEFYNGPDTANMFNVSKALHDLLTLESPVPDHTSMLAGNELERLQGLYSIFVPQSLVESYICTVMAALAIQSSAKHLFLSVAMPSFVKAALTQWITLFNIRERSGKDVPDVDTCLNQWVQNAQKSEGHYELYEDFVRLLGQCALHEGSLSLP